MSTEPGARPSVMKKLVHGEMEIGESSREEKLR
jgi:hypothetical protein